jgi:hypothetical protein
MGLMLGNLYAALRAANVEEEIARSAAEEVAGFETRLAVMENKIDQLDAKLSHVEERLNTKIDSRFNLLSWMVGTNTALMFIVLGKLFFQ